MLYCIVDAWLRAASEKKPKKSKKIEKLTLKKVNQAAEDSSMNALAAAGLNSGRQYSWANAVDETPGMLYKFNYFMILSECI